MELQFLTTHRLPTDFTKGRLDHLCKLSAPLRGMPAEGVLVPVIVERVHRQLLNLARPSEPQDREADSCEPKGAPVISNDIALDVSVQNAVPAVQIKTSSQKDPVLLCGVVTVIHERVRHDQRPQEVERDFLLSGELLEVDEGAGKIFFDELDSRLDVGYKLGVAQVSRFLLREPALEAIVGKEEQLRVCLVITKMKQSATCPVALTWRLTVG